MIRARFVHFSAYILVFTGAGLAGAQAPPDALAGPHLTAAQDRARLLGLLGLKESEMRPAPVPDAKAPNAANYDEAKANVFPKLPDPLVFKEGTKVKTAEQWTK